MKQEIIDKINQLASQDEPFLFVINYQGDKAFIRLLSDINPEECLFDFEGRGNLSHVWKETLKEEISEKETWKKETSEKKISETTWQIEPPLYEDYKRSFNIVKSNIMAGNSYLTNLTCRVPVSCNLSLEEIFHRAKGKYKLLLRRKRNLTPFVCFSPETFVRIKGGRIYSYPMKGTLDASLPNAEKQLMEDRKEAAEHATIVDLIRNDLSRVAENVRVDKYRYVDVLHTNKGDCKPVQKSAVACPKITRIIWAKSSMPSSQPVPSRVPRKIKPCRLSTRQKATTAASTRASWESTTRANSTPPS